MEGNTAHLFFRKRVDIPSFTSRNRKMEWLFAVACAAIPFAVALGSSQVFFLMSDTIFYLARSIHSYHDVWTSLFQLDDRGNFRPFTFWISSALLIPWGELNVLAYRLFAALFHCINAWIFYRFIRVLTGNPITALMSAFFFGLHWIFFNITYGMVCLPDLCYVLFTLLTLLAFQKYLLSGTWIYKALSLLSAVGAYLSKEMAVIIPVLVIALCWVNSGSELPRRSWHPRLLAGFKHTSLHWVLLALYLMHFALLGKGSILPSSPKHPYAVQFSAQQVFRNAPYFLWLANLPRLYDRSQGPSEVMLMYAESISPRGPANISQTLYFAEGIYPWVAKVCWLPVVFWAIVQSSRRSLIRRYLPLCLALIASLLPVLFLVHKQMPHNLYLANAGMALWLALCIEPGPSFLQERAFPKSGIREWAIFTYLLATAIGIFNSSNRSWLTHGSLMAENAVKDLQRTFPDLAPNASLYFLKSKDGGLPWYYDGGNLFRIVLQKPQLSVHFQDRNDPFPSWIRRGANEHVLRVVRSHIYDVTQEFLLRQDRNAQDLTPLFNLSAATVNRKEYYPRYDSFDTPNKGPAFAMPVHRFNLGRNAVVLIGGASVEANLPALQQPSVLALGACLMLDNGDGVAGRLTIRDSQGEKILFESEFLPVGDQIAGEWLDTHLDLSEYVGRPIQIKIETYNRLDHNTVADWLAWSLVLMPKVTDAASGSPSVGAKPR